MRFNFDADNEFWQAYEDMHYENDDDNDDNFYPENFDDDYDGFRHSHEYEDDYEVQPLTPLKLFLTRWKWRLRCKWGGLKWRLFRKWLEPDEIPF